MMKTTSLLTTALIGLAAAAQAGTSAPATASAPDAFAKAIMPISNPTLHGLALPRTNIHVIGMHQQISDSINTTAGNLNLGGDINVGAVAIEYAFNERLSLIATKDGYVDFNPEGAGAAFEDEGFANLAAGLKYAFIYDEAEQFVLSGSAVLELPTGNQGVFQGHGDGAVNLSVAALKLEGPWQFSGAAGIELPFDTDAQSITTFTSAHVSYQLTEKFKPLVELNWFHVLSSTDENTGHAVSGLTNFEGGDLLNLGAPNASANRNIVTAAAGARYQLTDHVNVGAAYEVPLTSEEDNLMKSRLTVDLVWTF